MANNPYKSWLQMLLTGWEDNQYAYMIEMKKNKKDWFFSELIDTGEVDQVIWTPAKQKATMFKSEEMVEEFKYHFLKPRKVSIIRVTYDMNFLMSG